MTTEFLEWDGKQPSSIVPLIGRKVHRAWLLESNTELAVHLDNDAFLNISAPEFVGDMKAVLIINVGHAKPGADFSKTENVGQTPHLIALRGMAFTGIDADVVMFGDFGVQVSRKGIRFVRAEKGQ